MTEPKPRVLVADDDGSVCSSLSSALGGLELDVTPTADETQLREIMAKGFRDFDVVVCDVAWKVQKPRGVQRVGQDDTSDLGLEVAKVGAEHGIPVILITGHASRRVERAQRAIREHAFDLLFKDLDEAEVRAAVLRAIDWSASQRTRIQDVSAFVHDLMNWATVAGNSIDFVEQGVGGVAGARKWMDSCRSALQRMKARGGQYMRYLRTEGGQSAFAAAACKVKETVEEVVALYLPSAQKKGIALLADLDGSSPKDCVVWADPVMLEEILSNLVSNAVKYTDRGEVRVGWKEEVDDWVSITVKDTGQGLDNSDWPSMVRCWRKGRREGHGIGLSSVLRFVQMHEGRLDCESEIGKGTAVRVSLPRKLHSRSTE